jgi:Flp pilus assembly protein TadG
MLIGRNDGHRAGKGCATVPRRAGKFSPLTTLRRAARDERGVSAVTVAISVAVLAPMALGIFDVFSMTEQRGKLQDALDAAALYAARSPAYTTPDVDTIGDKALLANLQMIHGASLQSSDFSLQGSKVVADASVELPSYAPMEFTHQPVQVHSEVQRAVDALEVALVLDNTGSMAQNNKLTTLQADAKQLIDTLVAASAQSTAPTPLKISLVPFSSTVRVQNTTSLSGTNYNTATHTGPNIPSWIDPQGKAHAAAGVAYDTFNAQTDRLTMMRNISQSWAGCVESRMPPYDISEAPADPTIPASMFVPYFWPDEPGNKNSSSYYNDYLNDVTGNSNWKIQEQYGPKYTGTMRSGNNNLGWTYGPNSGCNLQTLMRLGTNWTNLKSQIDGMTATGETNIPMGLVWGWHALSPNGPFADGVAYGTPHVKKVIILMTDGENTFMTANSNNKSLYDGLGYIWQGMLPGATSSSTDAQRTAAMDSRLSQLCTAIKARNIYVYTVRVEFTQGSPTLLQNCATEADDFYDVSNVANLNAAFQAIAGSISNLRISH